MSTSIWWGSKGGDLRLQKMHLHVVGRKAFGQLQRQLPRHGRVLLAVDNANRQKY